MANAPPLQQLAFLDDDDALLAELLAAPPESDGAAIVLHTTATVPELLALPMPDDAAAPVLPPPSMLAHVNAGHSNALLDEELLLAETEVLLGMIDPALAPNGQLDNSRVASMKAESAASSVSVAATATSSSSSCCGGVYHSCNSSPAPEGSSGEDAAAVAPLAKGEQTEKRSRRRGSKPGSMRNPSRERLLDELDFLRKQVVVLEAELQEKQQQPSVPSPPPSSAASDRDGALEPALAVVPKWERIAKRQLASCERAMSENKRLRSMLALQRELVAGMEETLYNWQHVAQQSEALDASSAIAAITGPHKTVHLEPGDDLLFEMLVSELDGMYLRVDEMFRDAGLDALSNEPLVRTTAKTHTMSDGTPRSYFEAIEIDVSPFEFEMVNRVARICNERQSKSPDCVVFEGHWSADGVVTEKYVVKRERDGADVSVSVLLALKEYVLERRVVVVWRSMFCCEEHFPDTYVQETGAFVSVPLCSSDERVPIGTLTKSCAHLEPKRFMAPMTSTPSPFVAAEKDPMTVLVMDAYHDDMNEMNEMMENMLLEESLKQGAS